MLQPVANPILHDFIKSVIHYQCDEVLDICKSAPRLKTSNLLKKNPTWVFNQSIQEHELPWRTKADVVWIFKATFENPFEGIDGVEWIPPTYTVVHEIKTGWYSVDEIYKKYWHQGNLQIWIWGWAKDNRRFEPTIKHAGKEYKRGFIKKLDIEFLSTIISKNFITIQKELGISGGVA